MLQFHTSLLTVSAIAPWCLNKVIYLYDPDSTTGSPPVNA